MSGELAEEIRNMMYPEDGEPIEEELSSGDEDDESNESGGETEVTAEESSERGESDSEERSEEVAEKEETLEERYNRLLGEVNRLSGLVLEAQTRGFVGGKEEASESEEVSAPTPAPSSKPTIEFNLDEATLERALIEDDPKALKEILLGVVEFARNEREQTREQILRDLPMLAQGIARQEFTLMSAVKDFYSRNEDLLPYQQIVGSITNEIAAKKPGASLSEVFAEVETETRKRLGLKRAAQLRDSETPMFGKTKSSRKPGAPKISGLRGEIAEMARTKF